MQVSEPSDPAEREADRIAKDLFSSSRRRPERVTSARVGRAGVLTPSVQRAGNGGGSAPGGRTGTSPGGARGKGSPLPPSTRSEMEGAFGTDFASVRVHTDSEAGQLSRGLKAQAFTFGDHIFFDEGAYDPESAAGKELLAHELVHTVQQREAVATLSRQGSGRTTLQCVNENLSGAGVASWLLAIVGATCGLIFGIAGSPTGPGAAGTAAMGAAICIAGVIGASVGFVLGVISGCWSNPEHKSVGGYMSSTGGEGGPGAGGVGAGAPAGAAGSGAPSSAAV